MVAFGYITRLFRDDSDTSSTDSVSSRESGGGFDAALENGSFVRLPGELQEHFMDKLGASDLWNARQVSRAWRPEAHRLFLMRRREIRQSFIDKLLTAIAGPATAVPDPQRVSAARAVVGAIRENLDGLTGRERARLAFIVTELPTDREFVAALRNFGPGVRHFSVEQQRGLIDRAKTISTSPGSFTVGVHGVVVQLVPYLSDELRQGTFNRFVVQGNSSQRLAALIAVAHKSDVMPASELNTAVAMVNDRDDPINIGDPAAWATSVATLGRGRGLSSNHRQSLLWTAQAFKNEEDVSIAIAGILDGASLTAVPRWPGSKRLEQLVDQADRMTEPLNKARLMAAICSAADGLPPRRAVEALKAMTDNPQNDVSHKYLFDNLASLQVSPLAKMSKDDRDHVIEHVLNYTPPDQEVDEARSDAIAKTVDQLDLLSSEPIDKRLYDTAVNLLDVGFRARAIRNAARRIAEQMQGAEPDAQAKLATRASDLVGQARNLDSDEFATSLPGLTAVLPSISDQQAAPFIKENLVGHVLAWPKDDSNRRPAIGLLLQSHAPLGRDLTDRLLDGI